MPGTTKIAIWNMALNHISQRPVSSDTEQSIMSIACARAWDPARRETLREVPWAFATVIQPLNSISGYTPPLGWAYAYAYPPKCLAIRKIYAKGATEGTTVEYPENGEGQGYADSIRSSTGHKFREIFDPERNEKIILSHTPEAIAEFTYDVEDTTIYDASCVTLLGYRLASDIATPLTGDSSNAVNLMTIYNARLKEAARHNSGENNVRSLGNSSIIDSRG